MIYKTRDLLWREDYPRQQIQCKFEGIIIWISIRCQGSFVHNSSFTNCNYIKNVICLIFINVVDYQNSYLMNKYLCRIGITIYFHQSWRVWVILDLFWSLKFVSIIIIIVYNIFLIGFLEKNYWIAWKEGIYLKEVLIIRNCFYWSIIINLIGKLLQLSQDQKPVVLYPFFAALCTSPKENGNRGITS